MSTSDRTDDVRRAAARALDRAMSAVVTTPRTTNKLVGESCGVTEPRVRRWRSVDDEDLEAAPSLALLVGCSWELFEELVARVREERQVLHGAPSGLTPEAALAAAAIADSAVAREVFSALADGSLTPTECPAVLEARAHADAKWATALPLVQRRGAR